MSVVERRDGLVHWFGPHVPSVRHSIPFQCLVNNSVESDIIIICNLLQH